MGGMDYVISTVRCCVKIVASSTAHIALAACDEPIREARRFRQAIPDAASLHESLCVVERDSMTDADEQRPDAVAGADYAGDRLALMHQAARASAFCSGLDEVAAQAALGAAERGAIEQDADVTGETESTGMRQAVAVDHDNGGRFAETQQAGHVREFAFTNDGCSLDDFPPHKVPHDAAGDDGFAAVGERRVGAGDAPDLFAQGFNSNATGERSLQFDRFRRREIPSMMSALGHGF